MTITPSEQRRLDEWDKQKKKVVEEEEKRRQLAARPRPIMPLMLFSFLQHKKPKLKGSRSRKLAEWRRRRRMLFEEILNDEIEKQRKERLEKLEHENHEFKNKLLSHYKKEIPEHELRIYLSKIRSYKQ